MKITKIRVWEHPSNKYLYDIDALQRNPSISFTQMLAGEDPCLVVEEYTGFKDKHGTEVFEGDLIANGSGRVAKVVWNHYFWDSEVVVTTGNDSAYGLDPSRWSFCANIIGHIHQTASQNENGI